MRVRVSFLLVTRLDQDLLHCCLSCNPENIWIRTQGIQDSDRFSLVMSVYGIILVTPLQLAVDSVRPEPFWFTAAVFVLLTILPYGRAAISGRPFSAGVQESTTPCSVQDAHVSASASGETREVREMKRHTAFVKHIQNI